jgi:hypothetical protein
MLPKIYSLFPLPSQNNERARVLFPGVYEVF